MVYLIAMYLLPVDHIVMYVSIYEIQDIQLILLLSMVYCLFLTLYIDKELSNMSLHKYFAVMLHIKSHFFALSPIHYQGWRQINLNTHCLI